MNYQTFTAIFTFGSFRFQADLTEASAPVDLVDECGEIEPTPLQTADFRHDADEAALRLAKRLGPEFWLDPDDDLPEDDEAYILNLFCRVEVESDEEDGDDDEDHDEEE